MIVRLVCVLASSSCIGTELAADMAENVESENTDFRAVAHFNCFGGGAFTTCTEVSSGRGPLRSLNLLDIYHGSPR